MFDSNYPSNKKRTFEDTTYLPTAERSNYRQLDRTPTRQDSYLSPSKRAQKRLSEARKSIDQAISEMSAKRRVNQDAIEEVRMVNQEILSSFSSNNPGKTAYPYPTSEQKNRTADRTRDDYSRDQVATSHFQWGHPQDDLRRSHPESVLSHENADLKSRLNEEVRKNNELSRYVKTLEGENAVLRQSQLHASPGDYGNALQENRFLRNQLQSSANLPVDILEQLRKLKEENQLLRRDTIALLKKNP